ncbi:hypothetical protein BHU72_07335 [Desulfuribacillus stibiiarsenatis]|uniref:Molybdopterin oxidoreductase n=1 Tax=Desulfuribacillus stibiiarsenatis TaxID=1390249 RepID=A0A1E5L4L4_9FIRM|nr:NrfD/PsrC family molybdoenzyme membrane anchor subunit [Desulfuribacillus stibiiarsenatis]OEH84994.1 hypothetical protein BHU72_07335 [Desulfuribacillus stibiiarsenatis]
MNHSNKVWWFLFSSIAIMAFFFMYIRINEGLSFTNLNNVVGWGLWVTFYVYFLGISVGLFLIYGIYIIFQLQNFRKIAIVALYSSLITLVTGMLFIFIDIGHLGRFWTVFINRNISSILSWELHLYVIYFTTIVLLLILENWHYIEEKLLQHRLKAKINEHKGTVIKYITYLGIPLAIAVHGGTGALFAVIKARVFWNSAIFPIVFLISAVLSGVAFLIFLLGCFRKLTITKEQQRLVSLTFLFLLIIDFITVMMQFFVHYYSDISDGKAVINLLVIGDYAKSFWLGQIGIGIILTLVLFGVYWLFTKRNLTILWCSAITCLIGIWFIRMNFIAPALSVPLIEGLSESIYRSAESFKYKPSFMEWMYSYFIILSGIIIFLFGVHKIPAVHEAIYKQSIEDVIDDGTNESLPL